MKIRTLGMLLIVIVMAVFLIINWGTLSQVTTVNLVYTEMEAPLGIIVVAAFAAVVVLLMAYTVWQQASVMMELRAAYKEARTARQMAEDADKSRIAEIRADFKERMEKMEALLATRTDEVIRLMAERNQLEDETLSKFRAEQQARADEARASLEQQLRVLEKRVIEALPAPKAEVVEQQSDAKEEEEARKTFREGYRKSGMRNGCRTEPCSC